MARRHHLKWLDRALVVSPVYFALCLDEKKFHQELRRLKIPPREWPGFVSEGSDGTAHRFEQSATAMESVIVCVRERKGQDPMEVYGLLVHEAVHIWRAICANINERFPSAEFEAYSIQHIAQQLMTSYRDQTKGRR